MKRQICSFILLSTISIFSSVVLAETVTNDNATSAPMMNKNAKKATQKDEEIVGWLIVLDQNEIDAANSALKKHPSPAVKNYANMLQKDHSSNLKETLKISRQINATPVDTATVIALKDAGKQNMSTLQPLNNPEFDKAFIDAMKTGHIKAIEIVDQDFLKNVSDPKLRKHLLATRVHLNHHLEKATELQNQQSTAKQ